MQTVNKNGGRIASGNWPNRKEEGIAPEVQGIVPMKRDRGLPAAQVALAGLDEQLLVGIGMFVV